VSEVNPSIIQKIESSNASFVVQQFLKDLLDVETKSGGDKTDAYNAVIDEYVKSQEIDEWVRKSIG